MEKNLPGKAPVKLIKKIILNKVKRYSRLPIVARWRYIYSYLLLLAN